MNRRQSLSMACLILAALAVSCGESRPDIPTDGRVLHVEADSGLMFVSGNKVGRWTDRSGLGHDGVPLPVPAERSMETLAGSSVVDFSGKGGPVVGVQGLSFGQGFADLNAGVTIFSLVKIEDLRVPIGDITYSVPELQGGPEGSTLGLRVGLFDFEGGLQVNYFVGSEAIGVSPPAAGRWVLVSAVQESSGQASIFIDGSLAASGPLPRPVGSNRTAYLMGSSVPGQIAGVLVYDRALSSAERASVEDYLVGKWRYR
jgi:Concanavalin A-like lectin/glucanases superfamily